MERNRSEYQEIDTLMSCSIDDAMTMLRNHYNMTGTKACTEFNSRTIYSDETIDEAYIKLVGCTKEEHEKEIKEYNERSKREEEDFQRRLPELEQYWTKKGRDVVREDKLELWNKCVPVRLRDLYHGFELQACLEIVDALNKECSLEKAKNIIDNQGHSGMSFSLVCTMVNEFSKRGREFVEYVNPGFFKD
jgi:gas vesicle protein